MPVLITETPEGPAIGAYLSVALQLSNVFAVLYVFVQNIKPISHTISVSVILILGFAVSILLSFFWETQGVLFGANHSIGLIVLVFISGVVGCLSVVVFYPFSSLYNLQLTSALSTGMGCNALIASLLAIVENPGNQSQRFSVGWYFRILALVIVGSLISFYFILKHPQVTKYKERNQQLSTEERKEGESLLTENDVPKQFQRISKKMILIGANPIINQLYICTLNYLLMGILNFAVIKYPEAERLLLWMNVLSMISGSIGRLVSTYYRYYNVTLLSFIQTFFFLYLFILCFIKVNIANFGWTVVVAYTFYTFIYGYTDTVIFLKVGHKMKENEIEHVSRLVGLANQLGAFIGSVTAFVLVVVGIFHY